MPKFQKTCARCGETLSTYDERARFCSRACMFAAKTAHHVERTCKQCGLVFRISPERIAQGGGVYCSKACKDASRAAATRECWVCGTTFTPRADRLNRERLYCSRDCAGLDRRNRVRCVCATCGLIFETRQGRVDAGRGVYCSKACQFPGPVARSCERCGKPFTADRSEIVKGWGRFCSNECRRTRVEHICKTCGTVFEVEHAKDTKGLGNYCSVECRGLGMRNRVRCICENCGIGFERPASTVADVASVFCSRRCMGQARAKDPVEIERVRQMQRDHLASRAPTRCERALYVLMDSVFGAGHWASQYLVADRWTVDACVPSMRLVVQADGDYWHGYDPAHRTHPTVAKNIQNDRRQDKYLAKAGWRVLRLWEHELLREPEACQARLRELHALGDGSESAAPA